MYHLFKILRIVSIQFGWTTIEAASSRFIHFFFRVLQSVAHFKFIPFNYGDDSFIGHLVSMAFRFSSECNSKCLWSVLLTLMHIVCLTFPMLLIHFLFLSAVFWFTSGESPSICCMNKKLTRKSDKKYFKRTWVWHTVCMCIETINSCLWFHWQPFFSVNIMWKIESNVCKMNFRCPNWFSSTKRLHTRGQQKKKQVHHQFICSIKWTLIIWDMKARARARVTKEIKWLNDAFAPFPSATYIRYNANVWTTFCPTKWASALVQLLNEFFIYFGYKSIIWLKIAKCFAAKHPFNMDSWACRKCGCGRAKMKRHLARSGARRTWI